jgi:hypothetical protein
MKRALVLTLAGLACGPNQASVQDAAVEHTVADDVPRTPDGPPALIVDFAIEGCPSFDAEDLSCVGAVPLMLRFVPLVTAPVTQYFWDFGDATSTSIDTSATPSHAYSLPGIYTVTLAVRSADGAAVSKSHAAFVNATASALGDPCDLSAQCEDGQFCLCSFEDPCEHGPAHGICTARCQLGVCASGQVCAGLTPSDGPREPWQTSLCLRSCSTDDDCSGQLRCRSLPQLGSAGSAWVQGCFSDIPADVGSSCLDATDALRDDLCASAICANLGAQGLCTATCSDQSCPPGSDCAVLGDGRKLCVRPCASVSDCSQDPLVDCLGPGAGDLGYQLMDSAAPTGASTHCVPKACASNADCLPVGRCEGEIGSGHCVARTN